MRLIIALLIQAVTGVLSGPDPAQMEKVPDLGYRAVPVSLTMPENMKMGASSSVAFDAQGHLLVFNRGEHPLMEFARNGMFLRAFGEGQYVRPHGMRIDPEGNVWTTDVAAHTVNKLGPAGDVLMTLGTAGQAGTWDDASGTHLLNEPNDIGFGPRGDVFVVEGHGKGEPRVLRFDSRGKLLKSWGGLGTGPGQFDLPHSIVIDARGIVYVADRQNRRVQVFDVDGRFLKEWKFAGLPCGLYLGADQQMYLASGFAGQILKLDKNGNAVGANGQPGKGLGEFGEAHYLTISPEGEIYVADTVNGPPQKFVKAP
jgi:DNA-binding beta-propeller fold protein YncE